MNAPATGGTIECRLKKVNFLGETLLGFGLAIALPFFAWVMTTDWRWWAGLFVLAAGLLVAVIRVCSNPPLLSLDSAGVLTLHCRPLTILGWLVPPQTLRLPAAEIERVAILEPKSTLEALSTQYGWIWESRSFYSIDIFLLWRRGESRPYYQRLFGLATQQAKMLAALKHHGIRIDYE